VTDDLKEAEVLGLEALKYFEIRPTDKVLDLDKNLVDSENDQDGQKSYIENRIIRKISTVLEFLAEMYELKKE
jgi:hypothetical protein